MRHPKRQKVALVMVGLPARGKTYMARKLARYLSWRGYRAQVFNVGNYRREHLGHRQEHSFFDPDNPSGMAARRKMAVLALEDLLAWLEREGDVAIYDATNSTRKRRDWAREHCERAGVQVIYVESVCTDPAVIEANIQQTKLKMPDYAGMDPTAAVTDFRARIAHYEAGFEPLLETDSFIKIVNVGQRVEINRIRGYLPGRLVYFLMNLHIQPRPIWLTRHGQSHFNVQGRIGGDAGLTAEGESYAQRLAAWVTARSESPKVWTSTLQRSLQTAAPLGGPTNSWKALDEIDAGICDGMTYAQVRDQLPEEYAARQADKLRYRYPRGESYQDVIGRLDPVIIELERHRSPVLVIGHQAVLRALYAYYVDEPLDRIPWLDIPLHTVIQLTPQAYGCVEERYAL